MTRKGAVSEHATPRDLARLLEHMNRTGGYMVEDPIELVGDELEQLEARGWVHVSWDGTATLTPEGASAHAMNLLRAEERSNPWPQAARTDGRRRPGWDGGTTT